MVISGAMRKVCVARTQGYHVGADVLRVVYVEVWGEAKRKGCLQWRVGLGWCEQGEAPAVRGIGLVCVGVVSQEACGGAPCMRG